MRKKVMIALLTFCLMSVLISGCGTKKEEVSETIDTEEISAEVTVEPTAESTTEPTVESTTEPEVIKPWAEENNITYSASEVEIPWYTYAELENGTQNDEIKVTQLNASYSVPTVSVSEPNEDGYITYTINYTVYAPFYAETPYSVASYIYAFGDLDNYILMDYYTGTVFPTSDLIKDNEYVYEISSEIEWQGEKYNVAVAENMDYSIIRNESSGIDDSHWKLEMDRELYIQLSVLVPQEYDGLVLRLDLNGRTEHDEMTTEIEEAHIFGEGDNEDLANSQFIRVKDLIN